MLALFELTPYDAEYGDRAARVKDLIWRIAASVLAIGHDVVLDWSLWSRAAREEARQRAEALGAEVLLHYVEVPLAVAEERVTDRNASAPEGVHRIDLDDLHRFAAEVFEAPAPEEAVPIAHERR
jgi:predicted kinase